MDKNRFNAWGNLDQVAHMLEEVQRELGILWNGGEYRMSAGDLDRLARYLSRVEVSHSVLRDTMKLFEALAARASDVKIDIPFKEPAQAHENVR